jgi:hypothetical protein
MLGSSFYIYLAIPTNHCGHTILISKQRFRRASFFIHILTVFTAHLFSFHFIASHHVAICVDGALVTCVPGEHSEEVCDAMVRLTKTSELQPVVLSTEPSEDVCDGVDNDRDGAVDDSGQLKCIRNKVARPAK